MVSRDDGKIVVWPAYFDKNATRDQGRRVPKNLAVEKPSVESIAKAAQSLGLNPVLEKQAAYSARHWERKGRVLIDKKGTKIDLLKKIAKRL